MLSQARSLPLVPVWETECALKWLYVVYQERDLGLPSLKTDFLLDSLRTDVRLTELVKTSGSPAIVIQEPRLQNSSGEAGRGRWCPFVECGIELIFVFVGSLVLSRRLCSLVESGGLYGRDPCRGKSPSAENLGVFQREIRDLMPENPWRTGHAFSLRLKPLGHKVPTNTFKPRGRFCLPLYKPLIFTELLVNSVMS
jgi:hypothetical protein